MNYDLSDEQRMIQDTARRVAEQFPVKYWAEKDRDHAFPTELWQAVCDAGLCGAALPETYGGSGMGMVEIALIVEELAAGGAGSTVGQLFILNPIFGGVAIANHGSDKMKQELLPKLCTGTLKFCMALTEPDAGINTTAIKSFARRDGNGGWRLNGRKIWITAVPASDKMLVIARTQKIEEVQKRSHGISLFMIDVNREGVSHFPIEKLGTHTLTSSNVFFDEVRIEPEEIIGSEHLAWVELWDVLNTERLVTSAAAIGSARLALKLGVEYTNQRKVFGSTPIAAYQGVQFPFAEAHAMLSCAREMNFKAAWLCDNGRTYSSEANTAKYLAAEALAKATERAMHSMGGMGFSKEMHVERLWRDARLSQFAPVPQEMILNFIAQHDLGMPRSY
jgi:acyl-CoA dehydrogenase